MGHMGTGKFVEPSRRRRSIKLKDNKLSSNSNFNILVTLKNKKVINYKTCFYSKDLNRYYGVEEWYTNRVIQINMTEFEKTRMEIVSQLKSRSQFTTTLTKFTSPNYWGICYNCGKHTVFDINQILTSKCECGLLINNIEKKKERKIDVQLIFENIKTFTDQLLEIIRYNRHTLDLNNFDNVEFLKQLIGMCAKVIFYEQKNKKIGKS